MLGTVITTVLPTPHTSLVLSPSGNPRTAWVQPSNAARALTGARLPLAGPSRRRHVEHGGRYHPHQSPRRPLEPQGRRRDLRKAKDEAQDNRTLGAMISSAPQCTFYNSCSLCAPDSGRNDNFFPLPYMYTAPPCVYKRGRLALSSPFSLSPPRSHTTNSLASLARSPDIGTCLNHLAETWELPSLSRLACTPYYKHPSAR